VSGQLAPDEAADGLCRSRAAKQPAERVRWLSKLAATRDPRVAVALGDVVQGEKWGALLRGADVSDLGCAALLRLRAFYVPPGGGTGPDDEVILSVVRWWDYDPAVKWWEAKAADVRRRAKELP
jgi:hypothetical protein